MSEEEKTKVTSAASKAKWASIITAVITLIKTVIDILMS